MRLRFHISIALSLVLLSLNGCAIISQLGPKYKRDTVDDFHDKAMEIQQTFTDVHADLLRIRGRLVAMIDDVELSEARNSVREAKAALGRMKKLPNMAKELFGVGQALLTQAPTKYMGPQALHLPQKLRLLKEAADVLVSLGDEVTGIIEAGTAVVNCGSALITGGDRAPCHDEALAAMGQRADDGSLAMTDADGAIGSGMGAAAATETDADGANGSGMGAAAATDYAARVWDRATPTDLVGAASAAFAMEMTVRGGVLTYTTSRSYALSHLTDPVVGIELTTALSEHLDVGICGSMNVVEVGDYGLAGGMFVVRTPLVGERASDLRLLLGWGAGLGTGPKILAADLEVESDLTLWHELSLDARWRLGPVIVGAALGVRELSVLATTLSVGVDL
jgi:hypothetical protein